MLTQEQLDFYHAEGYLVIENAIREETLNELRDVTDRIVAKAAELQDHSDELDLEPGHSPAAPRVRRIKKPHLVDPFYRELACDVQILDRLKPILGDSIRLRAGGKVNMKSPGYGAAVEWHQDWAFYPHTNDDVLAMGLLLDAMTLENGPMMVVPGSHRGPVFDHHSSAGFCGAIDVVRSELDLSKAVPLTGDAGSMTIHHARLIHGSSTNRSDFARRLLLYEYAAADAWPLAGVEDIGDFEEFQSRVICGQPTLEPRCTPVPIRVPLPRAPFQGSIYENQRTLENRYFE